MALSRNLLAGLINSIWTAVIGLAVVPFYLKYLGIEAYGLVGFFSMMQALFQILDLGLAPTMNREVARHSAVGKLSDSGQLLHTLAVIYWGIGAIIALSVFVAAPFIARDWLHPKNLSPKVVAQAVALMGLIVACRWPIALYLGTIMGAQRLIVSSRINMAIVAIGNVGAACVLAFASSTIMAYFFWQAAVALVHLLIIRRAAWRIIGKSTNTNFNLDALRRVWGFSAGMIGVTLSALVFTQLDKVLLSRILGLEAFGEYTLANVMVNSLTLLTLPLFNAVYPRFSVLAASGNTEGLIALYRLGTRLLATVLFPIAMLLTVFGEEMVGLWTGNWGTAVQVAPLIALLAMGSALHGVMHFPYALQLAFGVTRLPIIINGIMMVVMIPLTSFLATAYGAVGGAMAWLILHVMYLLLGTWLTHRHLLVGIGIKWMLHDVGISLALTFLIGIAAKYAIKDSNHSVYVKLACGGALALLTMLISLALSPSLRSTILNSLGMKKRLVTA